MGSLSVQSLTDALTTELRRKIFSGELVPGDSLAEVKIAEQYDVARPTAKSAIERLVSEGLLERAAHKTAQVPVMDIPRVHDMYFSRGLIECQAYRILSERKIVPPAAIQANQDLLNATDASELVDFDVKFHRSLIDALESPRTSNAHGKLISEIRLCLAQVQINKLLDPGIIGTEHSSILEAIGAGNGDLAAHYGRVHLDHAEFELTRHMAQFDLVGLSTASKQALTREPKADKKRRR
jgi:DNA-binding GntR family transcriptional regulator